MSSRSRRTASACWAAAALVLGGCGQDPPDPEVEARAAATAFRAVASDGATLGRSDAPTMLTGFFRFDDQRLKAFLRTDLPALVRQQVRSGRLKLVVRSITTPNIATDDTDRLARFAHAAGLVGASFYPALARVAFSYDGAWDGARQANLAETLRLSPRAIADAMDSPRVSGAVRRGDALARSVRATSGTFVLESETGSVSRMDYQEPGTLAAWVTAEFGTP